jgi:transposase
VNFDITPEAFLGPYGSLSIDPNDEVSYKLAMLVKGECGGDGPSKAAQEFGFSRQRYFQLRTLFHEHGAAGLISSPRGPKTHYRRTREVVCQVVRYRFLDADVSAEVIAQKLRQNGLEISARSVERTLAEFGLQKKTLSVSARSAVSVRGDFPDGEKKARRTRRSRRSRTRRPPTVG